MPVSCNSTRRQTKPTKIPMNLTHSKPTAVNRRRFLLSTAGVAAIPWMAPSHAQVSSKVTGANDRIRVALIGCGGMGRGDLAMFLQNSDVDCVALCDVDERMITEGLQTVAAHRQNKPDTARDFRR